MNYFWKLWKPSWSTCGFKLGNGSHSEGIFFCRWLQLPERKICLGFKLTINTDMTASFVFTFLASRWTNMKNKTVFQMTFSRLFHQSGNIWRSCNHHYKPAIFFQTLSAFQQESFLWLFFQGSLQAGTDFMVVILDADTQTSFGVPFENSTHHPEAATTPAVCPPELGIQVHNTLISHFL